MTKLCSLDGILTKGRMFDTSKGVVNPEKARNGMQTSLDEVSITELESSLDEKSKEFGFIGNGEDACVCKKLSGSAKTDS